MTRGRFDILSQLLACCNPAKGLKKINGKKERYFFKKTHPLYPPQLIWDTIASACLTNYNPGKELSPDEAMVKYCQAFLPAIETNQPRWASKSMHLQGQFRVSPSYVHPLQIWPQNEGNLPADDGALLWLVSPVVLRQAVYIICPCSRSSARKNISVRCRQALIEGLTDDFSTSSTINPRGTMYARQQGQMTMVLWRDTKVVSLLSTCHQGYRDRATDYISLETSEKEGRRNRLGEMRCPCPCPCPSPRHGLHQIHGWYGPS